MKLRIDNTQSPTLSFLAMSNHTYTVQYTDALDGRAWSRLADILATGTNRVEALTDMNGAGPNRFYRVVTPRQF